MYLSMPYKIQYDTKKFPFKEILIKILGEESLETLHQKNKLDFFILHPTTQEPLDQKTPWHDLFYQKFQNEFQKLYLEFINHLKDNFDLNAVIYQKVPTFRIHQVGNLGVAEWHKDKKYNHGTTELNFWLPFTDTHSTNTIWLESKEDKEDFMPYDVKYGEILVFSGANLTHGNKINETNETRVSMDFRLVEIEKFSPSETGSINTKLKFDIGGYFEKM